MKAARMYQKMNQWMRCDRDSVELSLNRNVLPAERLPRAGSWLVSRAVLGLLGLEAMLLLLAVGFALPAPAAEPGSTVMVVFNKRVPESKGVAEHYARLRHVPDSQVIGFDLPETETMTRAEFKNRLQRPLFDYLVVRGVFTLSPPETAPDGVTKRERVTSSGIRYVVLCYGVPLRILPDDTLVEEAALKLPPELRKNGAAVDSELALLPLTRQAVILAGLVPNPFYGATGPNLRRIQATNGIVMVARLDGPTAAIARSLVDKALEAEERGLWGRAYFDARGFTNGTYLLGDEWIRGAAQAARQFGFDTVLDDQPALFPESFPMSHIALYAGWYANDASGPFARPQVQFMPGAFAYHLHSYSAATLRSTNQNWVGPLLARGATISIGSVDEPYLSGTPDVAVILQNLLHQGASFGEAAYAAARGLSWQTTVVGDPLYRPCDVPMDLRHQRLELHYSRLAEWSHVCVVNRNLLMGSAVEELIGYLQQQPLTRHSAVMTEKMGDLLRQKRNFPAATEAYQQALDRHPSPQQQVRLLLEIAELQAEAGRDQEAVRTYQQFLTRCPDYPSPLSIQQKLLALAQKLKDQELTAKCEAEIKRLTPPPPTPTPPPPAAK